MVVVCNLGRISFGIVFAMSVKHNYTLEELMFFYVLMFFSGRGNELFSPHKLQ